MINVSRRGVNLETSLNNFAISHTTKLCEFVVCIFTDEDGYYEIKMIEMVNICGVENYFC